jgi:NADH-quinone oxidoreductase subunit G
MPRRTEVLANGQPTTLDQALETAHSAFADIRERHGDAALAGLGSAGATNEALFLLKVYFSGNADFRLGRETELVDQREDDLLRRAGKHPNTRGAMDLGLASALDGLDGMIRRAEEGSLKGVWIAFHPQLVGDDPEGTRERLERLLRAAEFSVVATPELGPWSRGADVELPLAGWGEETGTYTNFEGRVQIANCAVAPRGDVRPLHVLMSRMLELAGQPAAREPRAIFERLAADVDAYAGLDYDTIGPLGAPTRTPELEGVAG